MHVGGLVFHIIVAFRGYIPMTDVSVIIPTLDEEDWLPDCLRSVQTSFRGLPLKIETIVVDGGSDDATPEVAREHGVDRLVTAPRGRARQLKRGVREAAGRWLIFLHADVRLTRAWAEAFEGLVTRANSDSITDATLNVEKRGTDETTGGAVVGGWSTVELFTHRNISWFDRLALHLVARGINWRTRTFCTATGDQAIFVQREALRELGELPDGPILEGHRLARRLRRHGRVRTLDTPVRVSARRWLAHGIIRTSLLMYGIRLADRMGVSRHRLAAFWRSKTS